MTTILSEQQKTLTGNIVGDAIKKWESNFHLHSRQKKHKLQDETCVIRIFTGVFPVSQGKYLQNDGEVIDAQMTGI